MSELVTLTGVSGRPYSYQRALIDSRWNEAPGNYAFAAASPLGTEILYVGETPCFKDRFPHHERWAEAVRHGATHVLARCNYGGEAARREETADLAAAYAPPLTVRQAALAAA